MLVGLVGWLFREAPLAGEEPRSGRMTLAPLVGAGMGRGLPGSLGCGEIGLQVVQV